MNKNSLRNEARKKRRALTKIDQAQATRALAIQLRKLEVYRRAASIAFYIANDGEMNPALALKQALGRKKACYLPCLTVRGSMIFRRYTRGAKMLYNRYDIPEPTPRAPTLPATQLDLVLLPLVAFDRAGNRLGMGGGFYDRTFDFKRRIQLRAPVLVGVAHSVQEMVRLPHDIWDVPLNYVVTEKEIIKIRTRAEKTPPLVSG